MKIEDINISSAPLVLATDSEVTDIETKLSARFPAEYREYLTRLGEGVLGGTYVRKTLEKKKRKHRDN